MQLDNALQRVERQDEVRQGKVRERNTSIFIAVATFGLGVFKT